MKPAIMFRVLRWVWRTTPLKARLSSVSVLRSDTFRGTSGGSLLTRFETIGEKEYEKLGQIAAAFIIGTLVLFGSQASIGKVRGVVQDATGTTLKGAVVILRAEESGQEIARCRTEGSGAYVFTAVRSGVYRMEVAAIGFNTLELRGVQVEPREQKSIPAVTLQVGNNCGVPVPQDLEVLQNSIGEFGRLSGTVVDDKGRSIGAAKVLLIAADDRPLARLSTDEEGRYTFPALESGAYSVRIQRQGYFDEEQGPYVVNVGFDVTYRPISLERCRPGKCQPRLKRKRISLCE